MDGADSEPYASPKEGSKVKDVWRRFSVDQLWKGSKVYLKCSQTLVNGPLVVAVRLYLFPDTSARLKYLNEAAIGAMMQLLKCDSSHTNSCQSSTQFVHKVTS
ncbi:hypothetical protein AGIG_G13301 [Arapaima gigas]